MNIKSLRRFIRNVFDKGGVLIAGLGCLILYKQQYAPNILGPLSYGMISVGALGFARYFIMDYETTAENNEYQRILILLDQRKSEIEANREKLEELRAACESFMAMRRTLEGWRRDPTLVQDKVTILEELLKSRDCGTSMLASKGGSTEGTISDEATGQWSSSPVQKENDTEDDDEIIAKLEEYKPREDILEKDLEIILQKVSEEVLQDVLEEISAEIIDKESERVLEHISDDVQQEIHRRMQAELPESAEWEISDRSMEEIMEKVQKELFEETQEGTAEMGDEEFELLQGDVPELVVLEHAQEKPETVEMELSETDKMKKSLSEDFQGDMSGKGVEKVQSEKESQTLLQEKSKNLNVSECQETFQLSQENVTEQQEAHMVNVEPQETEECQEKLQKELAEALLE